MGKGGGKKGKLFLGALGFAFGFGWFTSFGATTNLMGGLYGASLAGTLWSTFNKPKQNNSNGDGLQRFDKIMNTMSSTEVIPIIYGERKWGGNQTYHKPNPELNMLRKHVVLCEGGIEGIVSVSANDLVIPDTPQPTGTIFTVQNTAYEDATIQIWKTDNPTANDKIMRLCANGKTNDIILAHYSDAERSDMHDYNVNINSLVSYINRLGDGWEAYPYATTTKSPEDIEDISEYHAGSTTCKYSDAYIKEFEKEEVKYIRRSRSVTYETYYKQNYNGKWCPYNEATKIKNKKFVGSCMRANTSECPRRGTTTGKGCYNTPIPCKVSIARGNTHYTFHDCEPPDTYEETGAYKNCAWLDLNLAVSDELNGNPNVTAIIQGKKVLDTRTNKVVYSTNPAMCLLDFLLSKRYGVGKWITMDYIDVDSFNEAADYCDVLVEYEDTEGVVTKAKRYELNMIIDTKKNAMEWIGEILSNFQAYIVISNDKVSLRIEKATPVSYRFNEDNITTMAINAMSIDDTPNRYEISFVDPKNNWQNVKAIVEDLADQKQRQKIISKKIELPGVTSQHQVLRLARFYRDFNNICNTTITITTAMQAMHLECGDVITVSWHKVFKDAPYRITEIKEENKGTFSITARAYNESIYNDSLGAKIQIYNYATMDSPLADFVPDVGNIDLIQDYYHNADGTVVSNVYGSFDLPVYDFYRKCHMYYTYDGQQWMYYGEILGSEFTMRNVKTKVSYQFKFILENTAGRRSRGVVTSAYYITGKDKPPSNVASVEAIQSKADKTQVGLRWSAVTDIDLKGYRIYVNHTLITPSVITNTEYIYAAKTSGTYTFGVVAVDNGGNESTTPAEVMLHIKAEPDDVTGLKVIPKDTDRSIMIISWDAILDNDLSYYDIRISNNSVWDNATSVARIKAISIEYQMRSEGSFYFLVKAVNLQGFCSKNPAMVVKQITLRPDAVTNLKAENNPKDRSEVEITWNPSPGNDIVGYEVYIDDILLATVKDCRYLWYVKQSGTYGISVIAVTVAGYKSNPTQVTKTIMIEPYDVTNFGGSQYIVDRTQIRLSWDEPMSLDVSHYEIRMGESWDNSEIIGQRVTGIFYETRVTEERIYTFWIKAVSVAGNYSLYPAEFTCVFDLNPTPVTDITLEQDENDKSLINISWHGIKDIDLLHYEVRYGWTWETAKTLVATTNTNYQFRPDTDTGNIKIMIKSVNKALYYSTEASGTFYATLEPQQVENFIVQQNGEYIELYWDRAYEHDVVGYEIREGWTFEYGALIATNITGNSHRYKVDFDGIYHYHIKAINRSNRYSIKATDEYIEVVDLPPKNIIQAFDEIETKDGVHNNTEFAKSEINWQTIGGRFSDYPTLKFEEVGGLNVLRLLKQSDGTYPASGVYECKRIDVGKVVTANISMKFLSTTKYRGETSAIVQMRVSKDASAWTIWKDFLPAKFVFRYVETRVIFKTDNPQKTAEVNQFKVYIDLPDIEKAGTVTIPIGGTRITYDKEFYIDPVVTPYAIGVGIRVEVTNRDKKGFTARMIDLSGKDVGGVMDWRARGY